MNYQQHIAALGREHVEAVEDAVERAVAALNNERGVRALCEVLVDMMACTIVTAEKRGIAFDPVEMTASFAKQVHVLVPRMRKRAPTSIAGERPPPGGAWELMPLSPCRRGAPLTIEESLIVQEVVEQVERILHGQSMSVWVEVTGRLVGSACKNAQINNIALELILEDTLGRAFEHMTNFDEVQNFFSGARQ